MLCDLPADGIYETRGAAMSSAAAASGLVLFLLSLPVVQSQHNYGVTYTSTQICALKGSTVNIGCSFKHPSGSRVLKKVWFTKGSDYNPDDLQTDSVYAGRVSYSPYWESCTLTIRDLRESDSAVYKFRFETDRGGFTGLPGVTLTVTAFQVHVDTSSYHNWATLSCQSSCRLYNRVSYIWYKNGQEISTESDQYWSQYLIPTDSYSCAVRGHEASASPSVCVRGDSCNRVNYSKRSICAVKGSSVNISCTYNSYKSQIQSKSWFSSGRGSEDLREEGRVEVTETERGRSTLTIRDLTESDSAEYHFKFKTRSFEWKSSLPGTALTVTDVQVKVSRWIQLDCVTSCNPYVSSYVWYKNGQQMNGASSSSYEVSDDYENSYSCALKGFEDFYSPLVCTYGQWCNRVNYSNRRICAAKGSSVDISCTYNSYESQIQSKSWFSSGHGSENLREEGRVEVTETEGGRSTLTIRDLTESDSAEYHFKFKTRSFEWKSSLPGTALTVTALQVKVSRIISVHESQTEAELKCESSCSPAARLSYVWFKNGQKNTTPQTSTYTDDFYPGDNISCAFTGYEDYRSPSVYAPKFASVLVLNNSHETMEGSPVTLTCSSDANPAASYTWYKRNSQTHLSKEPQLIFSSIQSSDSGEYYCTAKNELGQRSSEVIFINVKYPPKLPFVSVSPSAEIVEGSSVTLTCSSDANPAANFTWYKEDEESAKASGQNFTITDFRPEHIGSYYCVAQNTRGRHNSTLHLVITASSVKSAAIALMTIFFLAIIFLSAVIFIRKTRPLKVIFSRERADSIAQKRACPEHDGPSAPAAEQQDDPCYASVSFSKSQVDPVYSNIMATKTNGQNEEEEGEEDVEYSLVKFSNGAQGLRGEQAVDHSSALYSTVKKIYK